MRFALIFFLAFSLSSCASFSRQPHKSIEFRDFEKLSPSQSTKDDVLKLFGKPNKESFRSTNQVAWIYDGVLRDGTKGQKAAFSFDGNILVGSLWMPFDSDSFESVQTVKAHFKGGNFIRKIKGWDKQGHSYSEDASYYDAERGILFTTSGRDQSVDAIGFNIPEVKRSISSE